MGLVALFLFTSRLTTALWGLAFPRATHAVEVDLPSPIAWWAIAAVSIVNPIAEELVYLGVIANVLRPVVVAHSLLDVLALIRLNMAAG